MGFERSLTKPLNYVSLFDAAIDHDTKGDGIVPPDERIAAYVKTLDKAKLMFKPGAVASIFELAPLSMAQQIRIRDMSDEQPNAKAREAVACSLKSVTDFLHDGVPVRVEFAEGGERRVKPECMEKLYEANLFLELANRILEMGRIRPTNG